MIDNTLYLFLSINRLHALTDHKNSLKLFLDNILSIKLVCHSMICKALTLYILSTHVTFPQPAHWSRSLHLDQGSTNDFFGGIFNLQKHGIYYLFNSWIWKNYPCVKTKTAFLRNSFLTKKLSSFTDSHSFVHSFNGEDYKNHLHGVFKKIDKFKLILSSLALAFLMLVLCRNLLL